MNLTVEAIKQILIGAAITAVITLAAAGVGLGQATDVTQWLRNLGVAEAGAIGAYVINALRGYVGPASS